VEWEAVGDRYYIHEITCPYYHISQTHPEVCQMDQSLISTVLAVPVQKIKMCAARGYKHCTYVIAKQNLMEQVE
jgi:predicted ArsR family transcriptional regulator